MSIHGSKRQLFMDTFITYHRQYSTLKVMDVSSTHWEVYLAFLYRGKTLEDVSFEYDISIDVIKDIIKSVNRSVELELEINKFKAEYTSPLALSRRSLESRLRTATDLLAARRISTDTESLSHFTRHDLLALKGVGVSTLSVIELLLEKNGRHLKVAP